MTNELLETDKNRANKKHGFLGGLKTLGQYLAFILFLMLAASYVTEGRWITAITAVCIGSIALPWVRTRMERLWLPSPRITFVIMLSAIVLFGSLESPPSSSRADTERLARLEQEKARLREVEIAQFKADPEQVISEITALAKSGDHRGVKSRTEKLLGENNPQISKLHDDAASELANIEQQESELQAARQAAGSWHLHESISDMDDSKTIKIEKDSMNSVQAWLRPVTPPLRIQCHENETSVIFIARTSFTPVLGEYAHASVRVRIDDNPASQQLWSESTDREALFASNPVALLKKLKSANTLRIEFTPLNAGIVNAQFDLTGLKPHLENISKECGWQL